MKDLVEFLTQIGAAALPHAGQTYLEHCVGVHNGLDALGYSPDVCRIGFLHSIYGTERFSAFALPLSRRQEIVDLMGESGERVIFANCSMRRQEFDEKVLQCSVSASYGFRSRRDGGVFVISRREFKELWAIHLVDWLDQVAFTKEFAYRREIYQRLAHEIGPEAMTLFCWVYRGH